jgi:RNA-directed DNA polymerase
VRYADDFVILARFIGTPIQRFVKELLEGKMGLRLSPEKTRIVNLKEAGQSLDFLGYTFRFERDIWGGDHRFLNLTPSKKSEARIRGRIKLLTERGGYMSLPQVLGNLNTALLSWGRYFARGYPSRVFRRIDEYVLMRTYRLVRRKSQRRMTIPEGFSHNTWMYSLGLVSLGTPDTLRQLRARGSSQGTHG